MKEKINKLIIMEGPDLLLGALFTAALWKLIFPSFLTKMIMFLMYVLMVLGVLSICFGLIYCIIHICRNDELNKSDKIKKTAFVILFNIFYISNYYTKYVIKEKRWWGRANLIAYPIAIVFIIGLLILLNYKSKLENEKFVHNTVDKKVSIELKRKFSCDEPKDLGDYELYCSGKFTDETIGIFNYNDTSDPNYYLDYHVKQSIKLYGKDGFIVKNERKEGLFTNVTMEDKTGYVIYLYFEAKAFDTFTSVVIYNGEEKDSYKEMFNSVKKIN